MTVRTHLDLCPDCEGLRVTPLQQVPGVIGVTLDGEPSVAYQGRAVVHIGPVPGPCPNPRPKEA
ncbi:hypothetical protein H114_32729 [Streptomyces gancidicus BKS 13-15]|uniref:Uncharacterized protein n=1 Tax=Streptomyces gancidicus BKS 13-15 TaxID=1284664 RepID=M3DFI9_STREZ|nr:hypothetical protein [Streptomyces gancidicus]EMF20407.1 hypothetical protein H114_32729 [Streptomyces gancidicus BKS 13-15]